jgi:hypothetical protein
MAHEAAKIIGVKVKIILINFEILKFLIKNLFVTIIIIIYKKYNYHMYVIFFINYNQ